MHIIGYFILSVLFSGLITGVLMNIFFIKTEWRITNIKELKDIVIETMNDKSMTNKDKIDFLYYCENSTIKILEKEYVNKEEINSLLELIRKNIKAIKKVD